MSTSPVHLVVSHLELGKVLNSLSVTERLQHTWNMCRRAMRDACRIRQRVGDILVQPDRWPNRPPTLYRCSVLPGHEVTIRGFVYLVEFETKLRRTHECGRKGSNYDAPAF